MNRIVSRFQPTRPVDATPLAVLRLIIGVTFVCWASMLLAEDRWRVLFVDPLMLFKYDGFYWVQLWPGDGIWWHLQIVRIAAVLFALGFLTRCNAAVLALSMAYVLLVERQLYNNHDYLLACTAMLCCFLPCGRVLSLDRQFFARQQSRTMPVWYWWLVRFQLGMPYVFGSIAKWNSDWVAGQPAGLFVDSNVDLPYVGWMFSLPYASTVMVWGGLLFDLLVVPALIWRRSRLFAILAALVFHLTNATVFQIGVFPWFMLATLWVFFPIDLIQRLFGIRSTDLQANSDQANSDQANSERPNRDGMTVVQRCGVAAAIVYVIVQLLLPVRPWILPGNPSWNERGHRYAWRMMLRHKDCLLWYKIQTDSDHLFVPAKMIMTPNQLQRAPRDPELVRQGAVKIKGLAATIGAADCRVYALDLVSLNGRKAVPLVDPERDLTTVKRGWFQDDWVLQDPGPLPDSRWYKPYDEWWQECDIGEVFSPLKTLRQSEAEAMFDALRDREMQKQAASSGV